VENIIRPTTIGKKNFLFFGTEEAGQRSAIAYTIIANCRLHQVEPYEYLKAVLTRLPSPTNHLLAELTSKNWQAACQTGLRAQCKFEIVRSRKTHPFPQDKLTWFTRTELIA
jgi:transposase